MPTCDKLTDNINNFFMKEVPKIYSKYKGKKVRNGSMQLPEILKYLFYNSYKGNGKEYSTLKTKTNYSYGNFDSKTKNISIKFFEKFLEKSNYLFKDILDDPDIKKFM